MSYQRAPLGIEYEKWIKAAAKLQTPRLPGESVRSWVSRVNKRISELEEEYPYVEWRP